jgi:hypothetical protein
MLARSPNRKRATEYLHASGAAAIWIIERDKSDGTDTFSITTGSKGGAGARITSTWWTTAAMAPRVASAARRLAGPAPDLPAALEAVARSAGTLRVVLTDDATAISRASAAVTRLDAMLEAMRRDGTLAEFNARYKRGRAAAVVEGRGFMGYGVAMARLKAALIPMLQSGRPISGVFEEVFR